MNAPMLFVNGGSEPLGQWRYGPTIEMPDQLPAIPNKPTLAQIKRCEQAIRDTLPPVELDVFHHFADGLYGRELHIPAGTMLTGKIHKGEHLNFLTRGDITVWTEDGMRRLKAPAVIVSKPGTKRVGFAHTDTVWVTVHASQQTDLAALEAELIEPEFDELSKDGESQCLGQW